MLFLITFSVCSGCSSDKAGDKINGKKTGSGTKDDTFDVLLVKSPHSLKFWGWKGSVDFDSASGALNRLGVDYGIIEEDQLDGKELPCRVLVLADNRCMTLDAARGIKEFVKNGGKVLAVGMSGYRDENNEKWNEENNFILADIYGADFEAWIEGKPRCDSIMTMEKKRITLGRNQAMVFRRREGAGQLGVWLLADGNPQMRGKNPDLAVIMSPDKKVVYCGENLFSVENASSAQVLAYIAELLEKLEPGIVKTRYTGTEGWIPPEPKIPKDIAISVKPSGRNITVGLKDPFDEAVLFSESKLILSAQTELLAVTAGAGESYGKKIEHMDLAPNSLYRLRGVAVVGKAPYTAVYTEKGVLVGRAAGAVDIQNSDAVNPISVLEVKSNGTYSWKAYRGSLKIFPAQSGRLLVNNNVSLEEYVAGVVPGEMPATFPQEALKAQAVIARTFALSQLNEKKHHADGFDLCDTIHCQVYKGVLKEQALSNKAVNETAGIIAISGGKPAFTPFFSTCGGYCADVTSVWKNPSSHLTGGFDGPGGFNGDLSDEKTFREFMDNPPECYCSKAGRFRWTRTFEKTELAPLIDKALSVQLKRDGIKIGKLLSVKILERASDGRAQKMEIVGTEGVYELEKDKMRWITSGGEISTGGLPSTLFYISQGENSITIKGAGWGHGVGMCQEGAAGMAEKGKKYDEIISHYYKGLELKKNN